MDAVETVSIARRFRGPSQSGNGGYVCGRVARHIAGPATVRLHQPPPLESELHIETTGKAVRLVHGDQLIAEGWPGMDDVAPPPPPTLEEAETASRRFAGFHRHSFPDCFVCGTHREAGDGMRLFAGPMGDLGWVAAPWVVDASLADEQGEVADAFLWAALDCPSAFAVGPVPAGKALVLGQLSARIEGQVTSGQTAVVSAWPIGVSGRKRSAGSAVFDAAGRRIALALAVWIEVPESAFPPEPDA